jgi:ribosome-associated protein
LNLEAMRGLVLEALDEIKAEDVVVLDVQGQTDIADLMIVASGQSKRQIKALAANVVEQAKAQGLRPLGVEGEEDGEWVLVDLGDILVHLMQPETRALYDLERLWSLSPGQVESTRDED